MVKCPRCGYENNINNEYCERCAYPLDEPDIRLEPNQDKKGHGIAKKILIAIGIIVVAFLLFSIIYNYSIPSKESSLNVITTNDSNKGDTYNPYQVNISYDGHWYGTLGQKDNPSEKSGTGDDIYRLKCAGWEHVTVDIHKGDYSSNPLTVKLLKNGKVIAENTTTQSAGSVQINI